MSHHTRVYLITGFLGSGKTTFLNRIIDRFPKTRKLTILMNEFGEIGIDGTLVEGDDIDMLEISRGSIFCVCVKTDFIKGLYELAHTVQPDVLIIESTGVANPTDLKRDLQLPVFNNCFQFQEQFCIIDGAHFLDAWQAYASLEKQLASSSVFIINKTDLAGENTVADIEDIIHQHHPAPVIFHTTYSRFPFEAYFPDLEPAVVTSEANGPALQARLSDAELDHYVEALLSNPNLEITPPDLLVSAIYTWQGTHLDDIRQAASRLPPGIIRSKGFVRENDIWYLFSYVMGTWDLEPTTVPEPRIKNPNTLVFIGAPDAVEALGTVLDAEYWIGKGIFQPFTA